MIHERASAPPLTCGNMHPAILGIMGKFYHFRRMPGLAMHTLRFPIAMLPLVNLRERFRRWYRRWRNDVIGTGGYFIMRSWRRQFDRGPFRQKLERASGQAPAADVPGERPAGQRPSGASL